MDLVINGNRLSVTLTRKERDKLNYGMTLNAYTSPAQPDRIMTLIVQSPEQTHYPGCPHYTKVLSIPATAITGPFFVIGRNIALAKERIMQ